MENLMILSGSGIVVDKIRHNDTVIGVSVDLKGEGKDEILHCNLFGDPEVLKEIDDILAKGDDEYISFVAKYTKMNDQFITGYLMNVSQGFGITPLSAEVESVFVANDLIDVSENMKIISVAINVKSLIDETRTFTTWLNFNCYSSMIDVVTQMKIRKSSLIKAGGLMTVRYSDKTNKFYPSVVLKSISFVDSKLEGQGYRYFRKPQPAPAQVQANVQQPQSMPEPQIVNQPQVEMQTQGEVIDADIPFMDIFGGDE